MKIIITGGSGFIGTNLVEYYINKGWDILNIDKLPPRNQAHTHLWKAVDILDRSLLIETVANFSPDYVLHMAARTDLDEPVDIKGYTSNIAGVSNLIDAIQSCDTIKRTIFASSRLVCEIGYIPAHELDYKPSTLYGQSKVLGEGIVRQSNMPAEWLIVRPTSHWGPWFHIPYLNFFSSVRRNYYFHPGKYNPKKSFGFVGNTIHQLDMLLSAPSELVNQQTLYLADYAPIDVKSWANLIQNAFEAKPVLTVPYPLLSAGAWLGDIFQKIGIRSFPLTSFRLNNLITDCVYDTSLLQRIVGPLPYNLERATLETVEWILSMESGVHH
jgi:nucleoside-diphosphate-sugar epimerase